MAAHIASIRESGIVRLTKAEFYDALRFGDAVFCQGNYPISRAIERATGSCLSHVLMAWLPAHADVWLTAESTADKGVHVGLLSDYVDRYDGDLVIARCAHADSSGMSDADKYAMMNAFYGVMDERYNATEEVSTLFNRLSGKLLPIAQPRTELYCSQLWKHMRAVTSWPCGDGADGVNYTPEDAWLDPAMQPVGVLCK